MENPKQYFTLHEDGQWTLMDKGQPLNAPADIRTVQELAKRYGWEISRIWHVNSGKFVSL